MKGPSLLSLADCGTVSLVKKTLVLRAEAGVGVGNGG